jgi:hypothetical protein
MRAFALRLLPIISLTLLAVPALAATAPSGTAVAVIQATNVSGTGGNRVLQAEAPVYMGDRVNTGAIGEAQLKFRDDTKLVVGPSSSLLIDKFVFSDENTAKSVTINAVRGSFRFITGSSPKNAYVIRTPTATIGLRGTRFDFSIGTRGETRLALYEGGVRFCDTKGNCVDLTGRCDVVAAPPNQPIEQFNDQQKGAVLKANFPYFNKQDGLRGDFRINAGSCNAQQTSAQTTGVAPPPPPAPKGDDCGDYPGDNQSNRWGRHAHNTDNGKVDDSGFRPGRDGDSKGKGKGKGGFGKGNGGFGKGGDGKGGDGKGGRGGFANGGHGYGSYNGNWSGDGGMGRGGRGFGKGR